MTVVLHLKPEVEAGLLVQANAQGVPLEDYLLTLVEATALSGGSTPVERDDRAKAVRGMLAFGDKHRLSYGGPITRASLHEGHRYR
jgi:hypothetical protein